MTDTENSVRGDGPGLVVLDIGGTIGAAVITADASLVGLEVEIRPVGAQWTGRHVGFHERRLGSGPVVAAIFPRLDAGEYEARLRADDNSPVLAVEVSGGRVATRSYPDVR
jgi:hypothetical protein